MMDTGIFDPRGHGVPGSAQGGGAPGFRGWQGGTSDDLLLTTEFETISPQCLPGPVQPGQWHLAQWFIKSTRAGLGYRYRIELSTNGPPAPGSIPEPDIYDPGVLNHGPGWYPGNPHAHKIHSDGSRTSMAARMNPIYLRCQP